MDVSLTPDQLKELFSAMTNGGNIDVVLYDDIIQSQSIMPFFSQRNYFILFYPAMEKDNAVIGHYVCIVKNDDTNTIYFYDPLAYKIDEYKKFTNRKSLYNENVNSLVKLFYKAYENYHIDYNNHQHQSRSPEMATCGRHCVVRCIFHELSNEQYNKLLEKLQGMLGLGKSKLKDKLIFQLTNI